MFHLKPNPSPPRYVGRETPGQAVDSSAAGDDPGLARVHHFVELLEEGDRVQVLAAAELVRDPLAFAARVVEVEHRRDGVDPDPVDVVLPQPEQGVGDQEVAHLVAPEVEHERPPVGVRAATRVGVLVERGPVEPRQREVVAREVRRHPVEDHSDAARVHPIDERAQVVRGAIAGRGGVVAGHLVAPGAAERVRHHGQQLDVREAHVGCVRRQLVGQFGIRQRAVVLERVQPPRAEVDLVDRDRLVHWLCSAPRRQERRVGGAPRVRRREHDRRRLGRQLGLLSKRIGLQKQLSIGAQDLELVALPWADLGQEELPDPRPDRPHRVQASVPGVEVADDADGARGGRPDRERGPAHRRARADAHLAHVRAEARVQLLVAAFADQVQVELAERRSERVRVLERERPGRPVVHRQLVAERKRRAGERRLEYARGMDLLHDDGLAPRGLDRHRLRRGAKRPHHDPIVGRVRSEDRVRLRVLAAREGVELGLGDRAHSDSSSRSIPATGIGSQSGRLSSSYCSS